MLERLDELQAMKESMVSEEQLHQQRRKRISGLRRQIINALPDPLTELADPVLSIRQRFNWSIDKLSHLQQKLERLWAQVVQWYRQQKQTEDKNTVQDSPQSAEKECIDVSQNFRHGRKLLPTLIQDYNTNDQPYCKMVGVGGYPPRQPFAPHCAANSKTSQAESTC